MIGGEDQGRRDVVPAFWTALAWPCGGHRRCTAGSDRWGSMRRLLSRDGIPREVVLQNRGEPADKLLIVSGSERAELNRIAGERDSDQLAGYKRRPQFPLVSMQRPGNAAEDCPRKEGAEHLRGVLAGHRGTDQPQQRARPLHVAEQGKEIPEQALPGLASRAVRHGGHGTAGVNERRRDRREQILLAPEESPDERGIDAGVGCDLAHARRVIPCPGEAPGRRCHDLTSGVRPARAATGPRHRHLLISSHGDLSLVSMQGLVCQACRRALPGPTAEGAWSGSISHCTRMAERRAWWTEPTAWAFSGSASRSMPCSSRAQAAGADQMH